jgi:transcriptional regulator with XRE-family HTH domain
LVSKSPVHQLPSTEQGFCFLPPVPGGNDTFLKPCQVLFLKSKYIFEYMICISYREARQVSNILFLMKDKSTFGAHLSALRKAKGLSQRDLAKTTGISQRMIVYYENHATIPPLEKINKLAAALKLTVADLLDSSVSNKELLSLNTRTLKKVKLLEQLPPAEQRKVLDYINALIAQHSKKKTG